MRALLILVVLALVYLWIRRFIEKTREMTSVIFACKRDHLPDFLREIIQDANPSGITEHSLRILLERRTISRWCAINFLEAKNLCRDIELSWHQGSFQGRWEFLYSSHKICSKYRGGILLP